MARIAGIDLPKNKRGEIGLTYIYGIGRSKAKMILTQIGVDVNIKVQDWNDEQLQLIRDFITGSMKVEGELRGMVHRLQDLLEHALDAAAARDLSQRLSHAGFDKVELAAQMHGGVQLVGWHLSAQRAA